MWGFDCIKVTCYWYLARLLYFLCVPCIFYGNQAETIFRHRSNKYKTDHNYSLYVKKHFVALCGLYRYQMGIFSGTHIIRVVMYFFFLTSTAMNDWKQKQFWSQKELEKDLPAGTGRKNYLSYIFILRFYLLLHKNTNLKCE